MAGLCAGSDFMRGSKHTSFQIWLSATGRLLLSPLCLFHLCQASLPSPAPHPAPAAHLILLLSCPMRLLWDSGEFTIREGKGPVCWAANGKDTC